MRELERRGIVCVGAVFALGAAVLAQAPADDGTVTWNGIQEAYVKASNPDENDNFGTALALDGDTLVVGVPWEDSGAVGIDGDQSDNSASRAGAAYVFVRDGSKWSQQAYLKASNAEAGDEFGEAVAISGDTIVVGARLEESQAVGVNGDQGLNGANNAGAAYVFVRTGSTWTQQAYLKASNTEAFDWFGSNVAIEGDRVVVNAGGEGSAATGVDGDQSDNGADGSGALYVFVRNGTTWTQEAYIKASNTGTGDALGGSLAMADGLIVASAVGEDGSSNQVNGPDDDLLSTSGAVYVFRQVGTAWQQEAYLKPTNPGFEDWFGTSVSVSGNSILVGALLEDSAASGVNGDATDNTKKDAGAAYVFEKGPSGWAQQTYLKAFNPAVGDWFGETVALDGDLAVIGTRIEDGPGIGINPIMANGLGGAGAAYLYVRSGATWTRHSYIKASNTGFVDRFGSSTAVSGSTIAVGATVEWSSSSGVNGDQLNDDLLGAGAVYVFTSCPAPVDALEIPRVGSPPNPFALKAGLTGGPVVGQIWQPFVDHATFMPGGLFDFLALSAAPLNFSFPPYGTVLCTAPLAMLVAPSLGAGPFALPIPGDCSLAGISLCTQGASWDGTDVLLTNALDITLGTK